MVKFVTNGSVQDASEPLIVLYYFEAVYSLRFETKQDRCFSAGFS